MKMLRCGIGLLLIVVVATSFCRTAFAAEKGEYSLGVIPSAPPVATYTAWSPFVKRLSSETGLAFHLKVYETMADFERDIVSPNGPDFLFSNSLQVVVAHQERGYVPLVRGSGSVWVELFVRKDSPARSVGDLAGKRIAFVGSKNL